MDLLQNCYPIAVNQAAMTYLDDYILLENEHKKHFSLYGEQPDYVCILQIGLSLLQQGSGHFLVLVSLSNALLQTRQWPGFADSLSFLNCLFEREWPQLFPAPERLKGRVQMLDWLIERWHQFMETHPTQNLSLDFLQNMLAHFNTLQNILTQYCGNEINLISIITVFQAAETRLHSEKQTQEMRYKVEQKRLAQQALETTLNQNSEPVSQEEYLSHLSTDALYAYVSERLSTENLRHLKDESQRYAIFKHHRAMLWWGSKPSSHALDWQEFSEAFRLKTEQNYLEALIAFESLFLKQPLFLDLQYHLCDCLEALEAEPQLIEMLKHECQEFCTQHPELEQTKITDNIPSLTKQTRSYFNVYCNLTI